MADTTITPNMNLPVPVPSTAPGPAWADAIVADMYSVDSHDHTAGKGVPITPDGLSITSDLEINSNNLTEVRTVRFDAQSAALSGASDVGCLYEVSDDLYYNDGAGNQVRITQGGSVTGSSGTITGLPSGTASASFAGGTFTFESATSTPATMSVGPIVTGAATASPKTVTLSASASQPANYALTYPLALPASTSFVNVDVSGNMGTVTTTGSGSVVLATSPTVSNPIVTGVLSTDDGSVSAPAYTFSGDTNTGLYRVAADTLAVTAGGTKALAVDSNGFATGNGSANAPSISFFNDNHSGLYSPGAGAVSITATSTEVAVFESVGITSRLGIATVNSSDGYIKWKVFTGSLTAGATVDLAITGTAVIGQIGRWGSAGVNTNVIEGSSSPTLPHFGTAPDATHARVTNGSGSTFSYVVTVFYQ